MPRLAGFDAKPRGIRSMPQIRFAASDLTQTASGLLPVLLKISSRVFRGDYLSLAWRLFWRPRPVRNPAQADKPIRCVGYMTYRALE